MVIVAIGIPVEASDEERAGAERTAAAMSTLLDSTKYTAEIMIIPDPNVVEGVAIEARGFGTVTPEEQRTIDLIMAPVRLIQARRGY